jgi:hypothetical protein
MKRKAKAKHYHLQGSQRTVTALIPKSLKSLNYILIRNNTGKMILEEIQMKAKPFSLLPVRHDVNCSTMSSSP